MTSQSTNVNRNLILFKSNQKVFEEAMKGTLVVMFGWLHAGRDAGDKYRNIYLSRGFDVLFSEGKLSQFAWPVSSFQASFELLQVLNSTCEHYDKYLVHGISIGAYNYTMLAQLVAERPAQFSFFSHKLKGVIFDSMTIGSISRMSLGVASAASGNQLIQNVIIKLMNGYFYVTKKQTTDVYERSITFFKTCPAQVPTLILAAKNDPMSDTETIQEIYNAWSEKGTFPVMYRMWDKSTHAAHYKSHPEEYIQELEKFLHHVRNFTLKSNTKISKL